MAKELLTAHKIRSISAPGIFKDGAGLRLIVRRTQHGELTRRWELWIRINGKRRELGIGLYPGVSLSDAREEADKIRRAAREGIDLRQQRLKDKAQACTFREAFEAYFGLKRKHLSNAKHLKQWSRTMETYVFPYFGDVPVSEVTMEHVLAALKPIWFDKPETARRVLQRIEAVFKSAIRRGARERASPCVGIAEELGTRHREVEHHAALPWDEVPAFIARLRMPTQRGWPITRLAFEFLILTTTRTGETRKAVWSEIDLDRAIWTIPKERMKSRRVHRVPLCGRCLAILREAQALNPKSTFVFEAAKKGSPLSDMTFTKLLRDHGLGERATAHGFRSSFKNWCSEVEKAADKVSEAALAHTIKDRAKAAYLRTDFFEERRSLMKAWARYCQFGRAARLSREPQMSAVDQAA